MLKLFIGIIICGTILLVLGLIFRFFPPKTANCIYGYRTPFAMKSQEVWNAAQRFSANMLISLSVLYLVFYAIIKDSILNDTMPFSPLVLFQVSVILLIAIVLIFTEVYLRIKFDKEGNLKSGQS